MTTHKKTLAEFRKDILDNMGVSYDYYPPYDGVDNHCRWQCTDVNCDAPVFKSFPAFARHLAKAHKIEFTILNWMRWVG
jgi:hypothetical protein